MTNKERPDNRHELQRVVYKHMWYLEHKTQENKRTVAYYLKNKKRIQKYKRMKYHAVYKFRRRSKNDK